MQSTHVELETVYSKQGHSHKLLGQPCKEPGKSVLLPRTGQDEHGRRRPLCSLFDHRARMPSVVLKLNITASTTPPTARREATGRSRGPALVDKPRDRPAGPPTHMGNVRTLSRCLSYRRGPARLALVASIRSLGIPGCELGPWIPRLVCLQDQAWAEEGSLSGAMTTHPIAWWLSGSWRSFRNFPCRGARTRYGWIDVDGGGHAANTDDCSSSSSASWEVHATP